MSPAETQAAIRAQLLRHFTATLRALPAELALALRHPDLPTATFHRGVNLPWDPNDPDSLLECFDIRYWVLGTTPDTSDRYFDLVMRAWTDQGWVTRSDRNSRPRSGYTQTPEGYGLSLTQSVNGYLSMSGATPPFAPDSAAGDPLPVRIDCSSEPLD
ncbi:hypothetical protein [Streptomyces sp. BPTC-684]|uniref:hypothetical protein n=1 Tax=Streptomyces sp. BPTC-684 TaxID=3043734 RepID=UPI0024B14351|nr:hypothetical protein [Streptomyces sp. BPTC-684]WHM40795.1 hypothetical protein QIY60_30580 [Streptomyces sp. BPTC-684]